MRRLLKVTLGQASWTAIGHLTYLAAVPVLSRHAGPQEFGRWAVFAALVSLVVPVSSLRLDVAVLLPRRHLAAQRLLGMGAEVLLLTSVSSALLVWAGLVLLESSPGNSVSVPSAGLGLLVGVGVALSGGLQLINAWSVRVRDYRIIGRARALQGIVAAASQLVMVVGGFQGVGLILGDLCGRGASFVYASVWAKRQGLYCGLSMRWKKVTRLWAAYHKFAAGASVSAALNSICQQAPQLIVATWFGLAQGGSYSMAVRLLGAPVALLGPGMAQVYSGEVSDRLRQGDREVLLRVARAVCVAVAAGLVLALALSPFVEGLFAVLLGSSWRAAGRGAAILLPVFALQLVVSPVSQFFNLADRQFELFLLDLGRFCAFGVLALASHFSVVRDNFVIPLIAIIQCAYYLAMTGRVVLLSGARAKRA
jgi:O-antigen/teichoic acid export membrane protein